MNGWLANILPQDPKNNTIPTWGVVPETAPCPHLRSLKLFHHTAGVLETIPHSQQGGTETSTLFLFCFLISPLYDSWSHTGLQSCLVGWDSDMHYLQAGPSATHPHPPQGLKRLLLYPLEPDVGSLRSAGV